MGVRISSDTLNWNSPLTYHYLHPGSLVNPKSNKSRYVHQDFPHLFGHFFTFILFCQLLVTTLRIPTATRTASYPCCMHTIPLTTARYVDQGGNECPGAFVIYLEPWHADVFESLTLGRTTERKMLAPEICSTHFRFLIYCKCRYFQDRQC